MLKAQMRSQRQCHRRLRLPRQWSHLRHHDRPARLASSIPNVRGLIPTTAAPSSAAMPGNASGVADLPTAWAPSFIDHPLPVRVRSIPSTIGPSGRRLFKSGPTDIRGIGRLRSVAVSSAEFALPQHRTAACWSFVFSGAFPGAIAFDASPFGAFPHVPQVTWASTTVLWRQQ